MSCQHPGSFGNKHLYWWRFCSFMLFIVLKVLFICLLTICLLHLYLQVPVFTYCWVLLYIWCFEYTAYSFFASLFSPKLFSHSQLIILHAFSEQQLNLCDTFLWLGWPVSCFKAYIMIFTHTVSLSVSSSWFSLIAFKLWFPDRN